MFSKIAKYIESLRLYVIADAKDNSITFSRGLFKRMRIMQQDEANIICFRISGTSDYGFMLNPPGIDTASTQIATVMYNSEHKCIGFESLVPTVNRIFYDYLLPANSTWKLPVREYSLPDGRRYYRIERPPQK